MHLVDVKSNGFTKKDGILIKVLRQSKGHSARKLLEEFPDKNFSRGGGKVVGVGFSLTDALFL